MLKRLLLVLAVCYAWVVFAQSNKLWFTGYNYDGNWLKNNSVYALKQRVIQSTGNERVFACVDLANKAFLTNNKLLLFNALNYALAYSNWGRSGVNDSVRYYLHNLKVERLIYTGQYVNAYKAIKEAMVIIPKEHIAHAFLKYNRIKLLAKSIPPEHILDIDDELTKLTGTFLLVQAYTPYIETLLMQQQNFPERYPLKDLEKKLEELSEAYSAEGMMNLYYYTGMQHPEYLFASTAISLNNYLAYFRLNMGLVAHYINQDSFYKANNYLKRAHDVVYFLADYEVNRHYAQYYEELKSKIPQEMLSPEIPVNVVEYDYKEQFLASRSVAADLLKEANSEIEKERNRNRLFISWLTALLLIVFVLLGFVFYGFKRLKKSTLYNNWITTALSHDLRSPVAQIANALNKPNGTNTVKSNLISYEYLLDDTLNMALRVHGNKKVEFKEVDLFELIHELLEDLRFVATDKRIGISNHLPEELIVRGDYPSLKVLFRNILLNAIKHNKEQGYITIKELTSNGIKIMIENSIADVDISNKPTAGSEIIQFFSKQNKAKYSFKKLNNHAIAEVFFN